MSMTVAAICILLGSVARIVVAADIAGHGEAALDLLSINPYDIAVLDRDIPGPSVMDCRTVRRFGQRDADPDAHCCRPAHDKASGFELGADDYLTKPFELRELVLRLEHSTAVARINRPPVREVGGLR